MRAVVVLVVVWTQAVELYSANLVSKSNTQRSESFLWEVTFQLEFMKKTTTMDPYLSS